MHSILAPVLNWVIEFVSTLGFAGVFFGMAIEAASIPLPSEFIMGIAGFLIYDNKLYIGEPGPMNIIWAGLIGALGNALGSTIMYLLGSRGGRPFVLKYGKYLHFSEERFHQVESWFKRWGEKIIFVGQLLPIVRTFISLPLGILKADFIKFRIYTFVGAFIWCSLLAGVSYLLGEEWRRLEDYMKQFEAILILFAGLAIAYFIIKRIYKSRKKAIIKDITGQEGSEK